MFVTVDYFFIIAVTSQKFKELFALPLHCQRAGKEVGFAAGLLEKRGKKERQLRTQKNCPRGFARLTRAYWTCFMAIFRLSSQRSTIGLNSASPLSTGTLAMPALVNWLFQESGSSPAISFMA